MWNWISKLEELRREGRPAVSVTVSSSSGSAPRDTGAKMIVLGDGSFFGTIGGGHLEELAIADARKCLEAGLSQTIKYPLGAKTGQCCGGVVELLFEVVNTGPLLYLFGAGHVGQALCQTLSGTPFTVHLIDERPEWVAHPQLPPDVVQHPVEWDVFVQEAQWNSDRTYVAIMTHRHDLDQEILNAMLSKPVHYLGLIGSKSKWERFKQRLTARGTTSESLERVHCPIGLDVGGKAPKEIAISIAAELLQTFYHPTQAASPKNA